MRLEYGRFSLDKKDLAPDPIEQLKSWWADAQGAKLADYDAVCLSTVDNLGRPDARMVLLRIIENKNLIFFTNYSSAKAHQLEENSYAAMTIYWPSFERQVRVRGTVTKSPPAQSQDYFSKRPRGAQIGAWASRQSQVIGSRQELLKAYEEVKKKYGDQEIKCPQHWGGMVFSPYYFEFWQGRENRLHDRFSYSFEHEKLWTIARLMP